MSIIDLGTGTSFATISDAIQQSAAGAVISISAGTYVENFPRLDRNITLQSTGGFASLKTPGDPLNGKGILVVGADVTLRGIELSGATVPDGNGADIRVDSGSLTVIGSRIHNNQDGILAAAGPGTVTITGSEIYDNGAGDGYTHNLYIGAVAKLTVSDSLIYGAVAGHEIKSRALETVITNNRIQDRSANSSYSIDLPNGGAATVTGNVIQKGQNTANWTFIHFGGELYPSDPNSALTVSNNVFIADLAADSTPFVVTNATNSSANQTGQATPATVTGNTLYGFGAGPITNSLFAPPDNVSGNTLLPLSAAPTLDTSSLFDVPEPGSAALLLLGALACTAARRAARRV